MQHLFTLLLLLSTVGLFAQVSFPQNGVADERAEHYAFTNATIYVKPGQVIQNGTLVIQKGKIVSASAGQEKPKGAVVIDLAGKTIYPSFIDLYTAYGLPDGKAEGERPRRQPQMLSNKEGAYAWNEALKTEFNAHAHFVHDNKTAESMRKLGFGTVLAHRKDGISRGTGTLVALGDQSEHELILLPRASHHLSFIKGTSTQNYPSSLMGMIALLRQTYHDGQWYDTHGKNVEQNFSLEAWNEVQALPQIFEVRSRLDILRANKLGTAFGKSYIYMGNGDEYQRLEEIQKTESAVILPLNFPKAYDVEDPFDEQLVDLSDMMHWELAPTNPARMAKAGVPIAFTTADLKKKDAFLKHIQKAIEYGLTKKQALAALTTTPAQLINASDQVGTLEAGKRANFLITSGDLFEKGTTLYENWVLGKPYRLKSWQDEILKEGVYNLQIGEQSYTLEVNRSKDKPKLKIPTSDSTSIDVKYKLDGKLISLQFRQKEGLTRLSGLIDNLNWSGNGRNETGDWVQWSAGPTRALVKKEDSKEDKTVKDQSTLVDKTVPKPFIGYGWTEKPSTEHLLITNATVWTNETDGILQEADVRIQNGKIVEIGKDLSAKGATTLDGKGKHLTSGIIDEHSHIAISRGVNEGTQVSSAEVSIADVVNSDDVNLYRQLAGGVTMAQLLHGSANPIGGQSAIIKFRWGQEPEVMKDAKAAPFIKFALGENVKQSNWGDDYRIRFPQTRMGVEQVYEDYFTRAREYDTKRKNGTLKRRDMDLEAVAQILNSERFITCHSYQQGEINMLMKVADRHGFTVNTFTHILEGYKIADKMAKHGAGGSSFSDWWAYKYEVIDAIPYNAALMQSQGVVVSINSDDAEMGRRLNQEAAKSIKYGNMTEEEAWKLVTLNPAKLLRLDDHVGSIKVGKDADLVLWNNNPLSVYAKPEATWVDGVRYFDLKRDEALKEQIKSERNRLVQAMLSDKKSGKPVQPAKGKKQRLYHCDSLERQTNYFGKQVKHQHGH